MKFRLLAMTILILALNGCATAPKRAMPMAGMGPSVMAPSAGVYHTVERGQTLYRIAKTYNLKVNELMQANHLSNPSQIEVGQKLLIPGAAAPVHVAPSFEPFDPMAVDKVRALVGPPHPGSDWRTITIHHSATLQGGARVFDRDHRRRKMGGLFYHFVIGNGSYTPDGYLEVGGRWKKQVKANRPNDIQICLVGDFNQHQVSSAQFNALANLVSVLQEQYHIPSSAIRRHEDVKGRATECPGRNFPLHKLLLRLNGGKFRS